MDDEFNDYLGKFNEEMDDKNINPDADRSFLDKKEKPTDSMIINLFITDNDMINAVDITNYNLSDLGNPDKIKTIEGTEWILSKLVWYREEGRVITFDIVKLASTMDEINEAKDMLTNPITPESTIDITFEEVVIPNQTDYHQILNEAVEDENFPEAARLRDWLKEFKSMSEDLFPLLNKAVQDEDFKTYNKYMKQLNDHTNLL